MRRTFAILVLMVLAAVLAGCQTMWHPAPPLPLMHQSPDEQLVLISDFTVPDRQNVIYQLNAEREDVVTTLGIPTSDEQIYIYLFGDADKYNQFLTKRFPTVPHRRAFFVESETRLAVYAHWSERMGEDLRHEVAHAYLHASVPGLPLWLDEGLAEYFEVPPNQHGLNTPHVQLLSDMIEHNDWKPNLQKLEQLNSAADMRQIDYAESWAWVYYLLNAKPEQRELLTGYLAELSDKRHTGPLSEKVASQHIEPQRTLAEYITALQTDAQTTRK